MTIFRPCIDLHAGQVKQIVGGTLKDDAAAGANGGSAPAPGLQTNWVSALPAAHYAHLYRERGLEGAHVVMLGPGNETAAASALAAWPGHLQVGGGITDRNAADWIARGAAKVIVTSFLFPDAKFSQQRLDAVLAALGGDPERLVIDLSCRRRRSVEGEDDDGGQVRWFVAMNKWQTITDMEVNEESIRALTPYCSELLIHAADVEGLRGGVDEALVEALGRWCAVGGGDDNDNNSSSSSSGAGGKIMERRTSIIPITYAGGGRNLADLDLVRRLSGGRVDLTIGSALDCFGGDGVRLDDCVEWNRRQGQAPGPGEKGKGEGEGEGVRGVKVE